MSSASEVRDLALSLVGQKYSLGNEPWYDVGDEPSRDPLASDCSGLVYSVFRKANVKVGGKRLPRETAHDYYTRAERIDQPSKVGDLGFLMNAKGHVYHVFMYVGEGEVVESGDGTGHVGKNTVAYQNHRGAKWGRLDTDIQGDGMDEKVVKLLEELLELAKLSRVSEVARSFDVDEIRAAAPIEVEKIKADRDREVEAERKRLKL